MDKTVEMEIIAIVGILGALSLIKGNTNLTGMAVAGLIGFLSHGIVSTVKAPVKES